MLFEGHPSWRSIVDFYLKGFAIDGGDLSSWSRSGPEIADERNDSLVVFLAVAGVGITILSGFVKRVATSYTITNRRLHIKKGIVSRTIQETRLERVQNVNVTQGVIQRIFQIGDVDFDTAAGDDYNFIFAGVAEPAGCRREGRRGDPLAPEPDRPRRPRRRRARPPTAWGPAPRRYATASALAASRSASALSVASQVKSSSSRPKWP